MVCIDESIQVHIPSGSFTWWVVTPQQKLSPTEKDKKKNQVFDAALQKLDNYWSDLHFGGIKIDVSHRSSQHEPSPYKPSNQEKIHRLLTGPYKAIKEAVHMQDDITFFKKHIDRRVGMIIFTKCLPPNVCERCAKTTVRNTDAVNLYKRFSSPVPSLTLPGHCHFWRH